MGTLKEQRAAAIKAAQDIISKAQAESRDLTADEAVEVEAKAAEVKSLTDRIEAAEKSDDLMRRIGGLGDASGSVVEDAAAKSLGEHFVKSVGDAGMSRLKTITGTTVAAPEFVPAKANTDVHDITGNGLDAYFTQYDRTIVRDFRRPTVTDLFGQGTLGRGTNAVTYLVEGAVEGAFATVAEGGQKPQLHMADPTMRTDAAKKIAGLLKFSDEMVEDADFLVSEINNRGVYLLDLAVEGQVLSGNGTGNNIQGLLNRSGIQTETGTGAAVEWAKALFRATTKVQTATGLAADGIAINPADYEKLRLEQDANGQFFGGGFFAGAYGNGVIGDLNPPLWGRRTVVTAAVPVGTAVVGAFKAGATVYNKGGVRVESTNSHESDFGFNLITNRIECRKALAVRIPSAFVKVTLAAA